MPFEWSPSILMGGFLLIAIVILNLITFLRLHALQKAVAGGGLQELLMMLRNQHAALTEGFSESRRELREVSDENMKRVFCVGRFILSTATSSNWWATVDYMPSG